MLAAQIYSCTVFHFVVYYTHADVMELVDVLDSKSSAARRAGSSPAIGTRKRGQERFLVKKPRDFKASEALGSKRFKGLKI